MKIQADGRIDVRQSSEQATRILITGDVCFRSYGEQRVLNGESASILAAMKPEFSKADVSIMQFETVLTTADTPIPKSGPNLKSHPKTIAFLKEWAGDLCLLANNHTGDFGPQALQDTIAQLRGAGFMTTGAGDTLDQAYEPAIIRREGLVLGVFNICENEFGGATPRSAGSAPLNPTLNVRQIMELKKKVDAVLVVVHGGNETFPFPSPRVVDMMRTFADAGADAIVNIHPHCPQGIEIWHGTPIVYSLGNFYFPYAKDDIATYNPENFWYSGYCVAFNMDRQGCASLEVIPTHFEPNAESVHPLTPAQKQGFMDYLEKISAPIQDQEAIRSYHECWSAMSSYVKTLINPKWTAEDFSQDGPEQLQKLAALRNLNTCEAHHEIIRTYFRLFEQHRLESALALKGDIEALQKATYMRL